MKRILFATILFLTGCSFIKHEILGVEGEDLLKPEIEVVEKAAPARIIGHDYLALEQKNFKEQYVPTYLPHFSSFGYLDWTFGESTTAFGNLLDALRADYVRIHLLNTTCVRNKNCGKYEPVYGYTIQSLDTAIKKRSASILRHIRVRTAIFREYARAYFATKFLVSPALEHNLSKEAWRILADEVKAEWPEVQLVNSAMGNDGERYKGAWRECHGDTNADCEITSLDGKDVTDISISKWLTRTVRNIITFVWSRSYNCRNQADNFTDPRKRDSCPKEYQFEELARITDVRPPAPKLTGVKCTVKSFSSPSIWKQFAEDEGTGDKRANLPVGIFAGNTMAAVPIASNGTVVGKLGYYGVYQGNLRRYYSGSIGSGENGYRFEQKAIRASGKPHIWLKQGNTCWGPVIGGQRNGATR